MTHSLGCRPPHRADHPHHSVRLTSALSPLLYAPSKVDVPNKVFGLYDNDVYGICAPAALANTEREVSDNAPTQDDVDALYTECGGWDPDDKSTDNGCVISDVLEACHNSSVGGLGGTLAAYAEVDHSNREHVMLSVALFGVCVIGVQLPTSAKGADAWLTPPNLDGDNKPASWGGHCPIIVGYDVAAQLYYVVSWGVVMAMTFGFFEAYCNEAWAPISKHRPVPDGVDVAMLKSQLAAIAEPDDAT